MKTDFDYIKDKFTESGVNAPDSMKEEFVLDKIKDIKPRKNKKPFVISGISAAAVAVFTAVSLLIVNIAGNTPKTSVIQNGTASLRNFESTSDVKDAVQNILDKREKCTVEDGDYLTYEADENIARKDLVSNEVMSDGAAAPSGTGGAGASGHNSTYTQYTNVDEADTVKTDGRYIYYLNNASTITVFSTEGKGSKKLATIRPKEDSRIFNDFYIHGNKLIAAASVSDSKQDYYYSYDDTAVEIYDISDIKNIRLTDSFTQSGSYCSSRMIGSMMYVVSTHTASDKNDLPYIRNDSGATSDEVKKNELPCQDIYTVDNPGDANFLVVSSIDTDNGANTGKTKAILGSADTVYCNTEHLFVTAAEYDFEHNYGDYYYGLQAVKTQIVKVDLTKELEFTATAKVDGYIDNQYALDEKDGYLRVAATDTINGKDSNRLYILDKNLNMAGKTDKFAEDESIKAVRYIGDTAYVITYEETDPLFVIDTSDASNPKILGEVKISGFSTMLVPVDENTLLGIGYHTQDEDDDIDMEIEEGIKLALFDVSDKANPKVLDEKIFKGYYSEVQSNPKALLVNNQRSDYTITYDKATDDYNIDCGVINFKVEGKKIKIVDEYVSDKLSGKNDCTLERCVYSGNYIYMLGIKTDYKYDEYDSAVIDSLDAVIDAVQYKQ